MVVPELRAWRAARPRLTRLARAARLRLVRAARAVKPRVARLTGTVGSRLAEPKTWQYTAGAATAGLALAAGVVTAAGPWDSTGQRTAERDRAAALGRTGGADHGRGTDTPDPSRTSDASRSASDGGAKPAPSAVPVLVGLGGSGDPVRPASDASAVAAALDPLLGDSALGTHHAAAVVDITSGERLYGQDAGDPLVPASTTKIATAVAALSALGPDHRLTTRAALEPGTGKLVLIGGGDPTLTARKDAGNLASLRTLAADTATALTRRGVTEVTLSHDTTFYAGSLLHPIGVNDNLAPVSALMTDEARTDGSASGPAPRVADPAADAARAFADLLSGHGIRTTVAGPAKASGRAETLATVSSPPLSSLVERMLTNSDNDLAEALARQTAAATGGRADFDGGAAAIAAQLRKLGLPLTGADFHDGSGLNRADRLTADLLTALLAKAADPADPGLRPVLTGLPVAGFTGTLTSRYADGAAGLVRAKTGTLTGVNTLAGTVVARNGHLLAFAFLAENTTGPDAAQSALDHAVTTLATCACD
ncbi:D-alanyl-D-alanine carboxypeptidase/D-alanyl-D-alanine-endopeptidase [Streptomyces sp. 6-11-2]|uniref:D-alanyl-D-alanine carboxypeptidase/D-alanyl-D-alanine endopeptidase n=1 Tax=Streptomyces sp. 6-11-2 TaxID=2585753 RepID=UPI0011432255|nr:D-alanyl-D-alanine carboxypeptidase/D-alanyl-D-alanine-endopeptidase [Streptomyces sp. 6-11-2]GED85623.1 D-alanyl-D-alanine carboxypeptidase [Streptomyces sp. 6-11-2]